MALIEERNPNPVFQFKKTVSWEKLYGNEKSLVFLYEHEHCEINEGLQRICHLLNSPTESFPKIITTINLSETPLNQLLI